MFALPRTHLYVIISFLVGVLCVIYIRSKDRFEKEPYAHLVMVTVWGGIWSYAVSGFLYRSLADWGLYDLANAWGALLVIGPVEEFSKLTALLSSYLIIRKQLNEPVDGLLYMACVAVGYSLIENYYYALAAPTDGNRILLLRLLICTPAHINFSAFMGLAFYFWLQNRQAYPLLIASFGYASVTHGIYDFLIFNGYLIVILGLTIWLTYKFAATLLGYATAKSQFRLSLYSFLTARPHVAQLTGHHCPFCGNKAAKATWLLFAHKIQKCDQCGNFVTTARGLRTILYHFAVSPAKSFLGRPLINERPRTDRNHPPAIVKSADGKVSGFNLSVLNRLIEISNHQTIERIESRRWFSRIYLSDT